MKKVLSYFLFIFLFISFAGCQRKQGDIFYDKKYIDAVKAARKDVVFFMVRNNTPGANVAVSVDGKLVYSEGMGMASKDLEVPATRETKFRIGEVSEVFTSMLYQLMVADGILNPDSTVQHYLPDFPEKKYDLKLRHLIHQTSGLRRPAGQEDDWRGLNISLQKGLEQFKNDSLTAPPGYFQALSMYNYNLLGAIMEKATGKWYNNLLKDYLTDTLHMGSTVVDHPFITIKNRADYFDRNMISAVVNATFRDMRYRAPSQGLLSTADDMVKLGNAVLFSDYIPQSAKDNLFKPVILADDIPSTMANGWILLQDLEGRKIYGRSGSVTGGSAALLIYPEENIVVAFACNLKLLPDDIPVFEIASHFKPGAGDAGKTEEK